MKLIRDRRGALWLWAVAVLTIIVMAILWFALGWPTTMIITFVESQHTFTGTSSYAVDLIKAILLWFPILMVLGLFIWVAVNSQRKEPFEP